MCLSFSLDSPRAWSNEVSGLHASAKGVWGRNSGLHDSWQKSTEQARPHSLEQLSHGAPRGPGYVVSTNKYKRSGT